MLKEPNSTHTQTHICSKSHHQICQIMQNQQLTGIMRPVHNNKFDSSTWISRNDFKFDDCKSPNSCWNERNRNKHTIRISEQARYCIVSNGKWLGKRRRWRSGREKKKNNKHKKCRSYARKDERIPDAKNKQRKTTTTTTAATAKNGWFDIHSMRSERQK